MILIVGQSKVTLYSDCSVVVEGEERLCVLHVTAKAVEKRIANLKLRVCAVDGQS